MKNQLDPNGMLYKKWFKKQYDIYAWCEVCERNIKVGGMGKSGIKQNALTKYHKDRIVPNSEEKIIPNELEVNQKEETIENIGENISKDEILSSLFCAVYDIDFLVNEHASNIF